MKELENELISNFDVRKFIEEYYEPVEDKPGYVWLSRRNLQIVNIDILAVCLGKIYKSMGESEGRE